MTKKYTLPELLAPAGSPDAFRAALAGGADAVYFGGTSFNARLRAENFTPDAMRECVKHAHAVGARAYLTLNTLVTDKELPLALSAVEDAYEAGVDALIVADLGMASVIHRHLPDLDLHASTQCSGHNIAAARELAKLGFTRMVLARETSAANIAAFVKEGQMEAEVFVHGALCVSHSGQCLFSSLVGGRSGNRGECAQPCRLPDAKGRYPLSLKDLSLARHVPTLIDVGVHSLKIEGRLKSPEYVQEVVSVWRRLLDEGRGATDKEMAHLAAVFSRGGFTDAYFTGNVSGKMMGTRSEEDKSRTTALTASEAATRSVPLSLAFTMKRDEPLALTASANGKTVSVTGDAPLTAQNAPMDEAAASRQLSRLGGTPYVLQALQLDMDEGLMVPVSKLNALRRAAIEALTETKRTRPDASRAKQSLAKPQSVRALDDSRPTARFADASQITEKAKATFAHCYLPLHLYNGETDGVILPPVIFDSEREDVRKALATAVKMG